MCRGVLDARRVATDSKEIIRLRLLIVDDNAQFLEAARALLERQSVEVVATVSNGADAERAVRELRPDCVLLDIGLGVESGFDVATRLAAEDGPYVVLISVYSESEYVDLIANSPAVGFIPKAELSAQRIADVLDGARGPTV
jgi:DNA-binding NarL/FixJ family response regulator